MSQEREHVVKYSTFVIVWIILLLLTASTVIVSRLDLRPWNVLVSLGIASAKAAFVIFVFMHLRYERWIFIFFLFITIVILAIFIGLVFFDVLYR